MKPLKSLVSTDSKTKMKNKEFELFLTRLKSLELKYLNCLSLLKVQTDALDILIKSIREGGKGKNNVSSS